MAESNVPVERWLPVVGWTGIYEVSDRGQVRSLDRICVGKKRKFYKGRTLVQTRDRLGYCRVSLKLNGFRKECLVHHLVLDAFVGPRPPGLVCCHGPSGPSDNSIGNIRWGTYSDNNFDQVRDGTHGMSKRTHCPQEHLLVQPNLQAYAAAKGHRTCLACIRARSDVRYQKSCGRLLDFQVAADLHYARIMGAA